MATLVTTIEGVSAWANDDNSVTWLSLLRIDGDGRGGNVQKDPCFQSDTTLHEKLPDGTIVPLDSETENYAVSPPQLIQGVPGIVMGCQGFATNIRTGQRAPFVMGDEGPSSRFGEGSIALAEALGIPSSPTTGGTDDHIIAWQIFPGQAAFVGGIQYDLRPASAAR